jgi:hypothetical protein
LLLQSECMLWITYPAYLSSGCRYPANCPGFTWSSGRVWAWNGLTDVSMGSTKPQSGENTTLNIARPHLHLNPILPSDPALVHPFVKFSIPTSCGIYSSGPSRRAGNMLQSQYHVPPRRENRKTVCAFRGPQAQGVERLV